MVHSYSQGKRFLFFFPTASSWISSVRKFERIVFAERTDPDELHEMMK